MNCSRADGCSYNFILCACWYQDSCLREKKRRERGEEREREGERERRGRD